MTAIDKSNMRAILARTLRLGLLLFTGSMAVYIPFYLPTIKQNSFTVTPTIITSIPALAFPAFAIALLISIMIANRTSMRILLRPTKAKARGAIGLWAFFPFGLFFWKPIIAPVWWFIHIGIGGLNADFLPLYILFGLGVSIICYAAACLLSSGLPDRTIRFAAYCLIWWGIYLSLFLYSGFLTEL